MHRVILGLPPSRIPEVDHKDGNGINNRRSNLRLATHSQNMVHSKMRKDNKSGLRGVSFDKEKNLWRCCISINDRTEFIGRFRDPVEAAKAFDKRALELFDEFAVLNFPII
jgi:hypothetical protein